MTSVRTDALARYAKFLQGLGKSTFPIQIKLIRKTPEVPDRDKWRLGYLGKMLEQRGEAFYAGKETGHLSVLIDSLCSS